MNHASILAGLFTSFAIVACAAAPIGEGQGESEQRVSDGKQEAAPASRGDGGAAATEESATSGKGTPEPQAPADPTCVASCETGSLPTKCGDTEGGFCESVCQNLDAAMVACLVAAPDCAKTQWIRCKGLTSDAGAGTGTGGTKK